MYKKKAIKFYDQGRIFQARGRLPEAEQAYRKAVNINNNFVEAYNNLGNVLLNIGRLTEAVDAYGKALKIMPHHAMLLSNMGNALHLQGDNKKAVVLLKQAINSDDSYADAHNNLGNALYDLGDTEKAIDSYRQAIKINPFLADAHNNIGSVWRDLGKLDQAVISFTKAIEVDSKHKEAYNGIGNTLNDRGMFDQAIVSYHKAINIDPKYKDAYNGIGSSLSNQGKLEEAIIAYDRALKLDPNYHEALWNSSLALLSKGLFHQGWKRYEHGKLSKDNPRRMISLSYPLWDGDSITDKVILVTAEQGVGDEIMFSSCIPDLVAQKPKTIILECDKRLEPIFRRSFPQIFVSGKRHEECFGWLQEFDDIDVQVAIGSLPMFFRDGISSFTGGKQYLYADPTTLKRWKNRFHHDTDRMKIGISWRGGAKKVLQMNRSIELELLTSILSLDAFFVNLQYGDCTDELAKLRKNNINVHDWDDADPLTDLENFTAEISELDLVISVDNSTVHVAGALGVPVWVMLPAASDWRWMVDREDSPWYQSVRLFRQNKVGDWSGVIKRVYSELQLLIKH